MAGAWWAELLPRNPYQAAYTPDLPIVGFAFDGQVGVHAYGSDRKVEFGRGPTVWPMPPGCDVYSQSKHGGEYLKIAFEWQQEDEWSRARHFSDVIDPAAVRAAQQLRRQLLARDRIDELQCERFVHALKERAVGVLTAFLGGTSLEPTARSSITPRRLRISSTTRS